MALGLATAAFWGSSLILIGTSIYMVWNSRPIQDRRMSQRDLDAVSNHPSILWIGRRPETD